MLRVDKDGKVVLEKCIRCGKRTEIDPNIICRRCLSEGLKLDKKEW